MRPTPTFRNTDLASSNNSSNIQIIRAPRSRIVSETGDRRVVSLQSDADANPQPTKDEAEANPPVENPGHSDIFERLSAHNEADLVGLVAYGIYQRHKRAWIAAFCEAHERFPSQEERDAHAFSYREGGLAILRTSAEGALAAFGERVVEEQIDALRANALDLQTQAVLQGIDSKITRLDSYRHHVIGHVLGFAFLVLLAAFAGLILKWEPSVEGFYHWFAPESKSSNDTPESPSIPMPQPAPKRDR
jgi:hypothetical protein